MATYKIQSPAYIKAFLHACKYPTRSVNGVLVGTFDSTKNEIEISDAIPLFHTHLSLLPLLEVALTQIEKMGKLIVGYYFANERLDDVTFGKTHKSISDKIQMYFENAIVWQFDNSLIEVDNTKPAIKVYTKQKSWNEVDVEKIASFVESDVFEKLTKYVKNGKAQELIDFENHCDDISKDYRNPFLLQ